MTRRSLLAVVLAAIMLSLAGGTAQATEGSTGWARYGDHYVHWSCHLTKPANSEGFGYSAASFRAFQDYVECRIEAIQRARKANDQYEKWLAHQAYLAAQAAKAAEAAAASQTVTTHSTASGGSVVGLIHQYFYSYEWSKATCIADRESNLNPNAQNPYSGAAGVFQWMPSIWPSVSASAGWGGYSAFNATANVATSAWYVHYYGSWSPWASTEHPC